jgi:hypothetical protein
MIVNKREVLFTCAGLLPCLGLGFSTLQTFGETRNELVLKQGLKYFVAVDGNDDGPGTAERPWATINYAAEQVTAGNTVVLRGGHYILTAQIRPRNSGRSDAWITFMGYPGEEVILDAQMIPHSSLAPTGLDNGAFQIEGISYIRVANLAVVNSHDAGFTVRDASNVDLINNSTKGTFSSGIAVFDTDHDDKGTKNVRIIGNSIAKATTWDLLPDDIPKQGEPPHEAISIGGAIDFEVAYNHVYDCEKEGISVKETSKRGRVHHNYVHDIARQGIDVDAYFGHLTEIEIFSNVVRHCRGAGVVISVEEGKSVENISIHNNLLFNNEGSGLYFSRWGVNGARQNIHIANNTFYHNGYGPPSAGQMYYWMTGGLYLYSSNVHDISIIENIFSDNCGFQIGYSELFLETKQSWQSVAREKKIQISTNLIDGRNRIGDPIRSGGYPSDRVRIYAAHGDRAIFASPRFKDAANEDFGLRRGSPAAVGRAVVGAYAPDLRSQQWWKQNFPPYFVSDH